MKTILPSVFAYNDFRKFLADYQQSIKVVDKSYSRAGMCRKIGLPNTRSYFNDVLKGKELSRTFVERLVRALCLGAEEARYFRALVSFNQALTADDREIYFERLIELNKTPKKQVNPRAYAYYKQWYHSAIRALLDVESFKDDFGRMANQLQPPVSSQKVRESIHLLKELGLIKIDKQGHYKATDKTITAEPYTQNELVKQFQLKCIELASQALLRNHSLPQNISTNTISISDIGYRRLEKRLQRFKAEVRSIIHRDEKPARRVYQMNIQLFPLSK